MKWSASKSNPISMSIIDLFSKRQKRLRGEVSDVYIYNKIPEELRVQILYILDEALGTSEEYHRLYNSEVAQVYSLITSTLSREYGWMDLQRGGRRNSDSSYSELRNFIYQEADVERVLDAVELSFKFADKGTRRYDYRNTNNYNAVIDNALSELNARFQEHGVGFRYESGEIIRIDSEFIHSDVVKPALILLQDKHFAGAESEYLNAHEHYRHKRYKESLTDALKALESCMKAIAAKRKWTCDSKSTAKPLIDLMFSKGVIPDFWSSHFAGLRSILESGVPTARNRLGGHGQGTQVVDVPEHLVAFVLHQTAAAIVFLVSAERALP